MSQFPPQQPPQGQTVPYGNPPAPPKTSGAAIAALIVSLLGCVPGVGLLAVVLAILGISKTKDPRYTGRGLAIAGLIIGILSLGVWGLFGGGIWALVKGTAPQREMAKAFTQDLASGNVTAAQQKCVSGTTLQSLTAAAASLQTLGGLKDTTFFGVKAESSTSAESITALTGKADFNNGASKTVIIEMVKESGVWKIRSFSYN